MAELVTKLPAPMPELEPCPFCGGPAQIFKEQLWHNGHGYYGNYDYFIGCQNINCKIQPITRKIDDIYRADKTAIRICINNWNTREVKP